MLIYVIVIHSTDLQIFRMLYFTFLKQHVICLEKIYFAQHTQKYPICNGIQNYYET
jgi:hypothetical protein